jgi:hypothetical protein
MDEVVAPDALYQGTTLVGPLKVSHSRRRNGTRVPHISRFVRDVGGNFPENCNRGNALFPNS